MTSKIAKLQALLYMAGDGGIKKEQLRDLLQLADPEIESLAKRLQENWPVIRTAACSFWKSTTNIN